jgi:hypothetical protein
MPEVRLAKPAALVIGGSMSGLLAALRSQRVVCGRVFERVAEPLAGRGAGSWRSPN